MSSKRRLIDTNDDNNNVRIISQPNLITVATAPINTNTNISQNTKKTGPHPQGIATLKLIQQRARELKQEKNIKHREAIAQAGAEYREKNNTIRAHVKKSKK